MVLGCRVVGDTKVKTSKNDQSGPESHIEDFGCFSHHDFYSADRKEPHKPSCSRALETCGVSRVGTLESARACFRCLTQSALCKK